MSNILRLYARGTVSSRDLFEEDGVIQSVDRSIRILLALQGARRLSLSDLAARLQLPSSTVHGILRTLAAHGMVEQEPVAALHARPRRAAAQQRLPRQPRVPQPGSAVDRG